MNNMNLGEIIKKLAATGDEVYAKICRVDSVSGNLMDLSPIDGSASIVDVKISISPEASDVIEFKPKEGSLVLVVFYDKHHAALVACSEIEQFKIKISGTELIVDETGFKISRGTESLAGLIDALFDAILAMTFVDSAGTTATPINGAQFTALKTRFSQLLTS